MSEVAAAFYGKVKVERRGIPPSQQAGFRREFIERVIEFDGVEMLDVVGQHPGGGETRRIEIPHPMLVMPA